MKRIKIGSPLMALVALALLTSGTVAQEREREIGVTSAVNPQASGTPPVSPRRTLEIGTNVIHNERVVTTDQGQAHMLFHDGSALTVGLDSEVVLDTFVYDPDAKTGELAFSATKGIFRLVGGRISKTSPVLFKTLAATIGIRGGIIIVRVFEDGRVSATFLFGIEMTVSNKHGTVTVRRPGFTIELAGPDQDPSDAPLFLAPPELLTAALDALEGGDLARARTAAGEGPSAAEVDAAAPQVVELGSLNEPAVFAALDTSQLDPLTVQVLRDSSLDALLDEPLVNSEQVAGAATLEDFADDPLIDVEPFVSDAVLASSPTPSTALTPDQVEESATTTAASQLEGVDLQALGEAGQTPIVEPASTVTALASGTIISPTAVIGVYVGRYKRSTTTATGTQDGVAGSDIAFAGGALVNGRFIESTSTFLEFPLAFGTFAFNGLADSTGSPFGEITGTGFFTADAKFLFINATEDNFPGNRVFAFAGIPTATFPTGGTNSYELATDFALNSNIPFLSNAGGGSLAPPARPKVFIRWDAPAAGGHRPFGGGIVFISGAGATQQSVASVYGGRVLFDTLGRAFLRGGMASTARLTATDPPSFTQAGISTSDAGDGSDFFGNGPDYFVLDSTEVDGFDNVIARGADQQIKNAATTVFPNVVALDKPVAGIGLNRTTRTLTGKVGGQVQQFSTLSGAILSTNYIQSAGNTLTVNTDAGTNIITAAMAFADSAVNAYGFAIGGQSNGNSAGLFIDDDNFFAAGGALGAVTFAGVTPTAAVFGLSTSAQLQHTGFVPGGVTFCACQFLEWGFWGAQADLTANTVGVVHLATWVAGELSATSQLAVGASTTATYNGHVFGTVNNNGALYEAVGDLTATFTFNIGGAFFFDTASITNFDGTNYAFNFIATGTSFATTAYNTATAGFNLQGTHPMGGLVTAVLEGNFFGPSTPPDETGGAFHVTNGAVTYTASGTFAAKR